MILINDFQIIIIIQYFVLFLHYINIIYYEHFRLNDNILYNYTSFFLRFNSITFKSIQLRISILEFLQFSNSYLLT